MGMMIDPGAEYLVRARVATDKDDLWDAGDHVRMRIGERGTFHTLWIPRGLILPLPSCLVLAPRT